MRRPRPVTAAAAALALALASALPTLAAAQTATAGSTAGTGSANCTALVQAATDAMAARIQADDQSISAPKSVFQLTCLNNFFNGVGLNVVQNFLNPSNLLAAVQGQICNYVNQAWQNFVGSAQCGLTITGFNLGFGGLGGGLMCPRLSFGGGGPPIASVGIGAGLGGSGSYGAQAVPPTGYTAPLAAGLY